MQIILISFAVHHHPILISSSSAQKKRNLLKKFMHDMQKRYCYVVGGKWLVSNAVKKGKYEMNVKSKTRTDILSSRIDHWSGIIIIAFTITGSFTYNAQVCISNYILQHNLHYGQPNKAITIMFMVCFHKKAQKFFSSARKNWLMRYNYLYLVHL